MRYALSSNEEVWVKSCYQFFEKYGMYDWYEVPKMQAIREILHNSGGRLNPMWTREKVFELYKGVGIE